MSYHTCMHVSSQIQTIIVGLAVVFSTCIYYLSYYFNCVDLPARLPATVISGRDGCSPDGLTDYIESLQYQYLELLDGILHHLGQ